MHVVIYITLLIAIILIYLLITKDKILISPKSRKKVIIFTIVISIFALLGACGHWSNVKSFEKGEYKLIEGQIEDFVPASEGIKGTESFEVNGMKFSYAFSEIIGGLNHSISGSIKNGSIVKIYYKNNAILRFELKE